MPEQQQTRPQEWVADDTRLGRDEFLALEKTYKMIRYAYPVLTSYPKAVRFTLVEKMENLLDEILDGLIEYGKKYYKQTTLQTVDKNIAKLKFFIRLSLDLKYISPGQYREWQDLVLEIGRMVGGLIAAFSQQPRQPQHKQGTRDGAPR